MRSGPKIALIIIAALIGGGLIGFITTGVATAGTLEEDFSFTHESSTVPSITELNLNFYVK